MKICKIDNNYKCNASFSRRNFCDKDVASFCSHLYKPTNMPHESLIASRGYVDSKIDEALTHKPAQRRSLDRYIDSKIERALTHMASKSYVKSEINSVLKSHKDIGHEGRPTPSKELKHTEITWRRANGNCVRIVDMQSKHIENCICLIDRTKKRSFDMIVYNCMKEELKRRDYKY